MKTIAVLTMAFLPATFLAAMFSMPSLEWDTSAPDKFVVYWVCVILTTVATFGLWAGITQRQQIRELLKSAGMQYPKARAKGKKEDLV